MLQVAQTPAPAVQKAVAGDTQTIKVDIKATHDATTPVGLLVEPAEKGAGEAHERPAATTSVGPLAPAPLPEAHEEAPKEAPQPKVQAPVPQPEVQTLAPQPEEAAQPVQKEVRPSPLSSLPQDGSNMHAIYCGTPSNAARNSAVPSYPSTTPSSCQAALHPISEPPSCTASLRELDGGDE